MQTEHMMTMTYDEVDDGYSNEAARASAYFLIERGGLKDQTPRAAALTAAGKVVVMVSGVIYGPSSEVLGADIEVDQVFDTEAEAEAYVASHLDNDCGYEFYHFVYRAPAPVVEAPVEDEDDDCPF